MVIRRSLNAIGLLAFTLLASPLHTAWAGESYTLSHKSKVGEVTRVQLQLKVGGDVRLAALGKTRDLPMSVDAKLTYDERLMAVDNTTAGAFRALRHYDEAEATITVDKGSVKPTLDPQRNLLAVDTGKLGTKIFCPNSPLTRDELDLVDLPGNSLLIDQLLPSDPVAIGGNWKHSDQSIAGILGLDAVSFSDVQSVLVDVASGKASITLSGAVQGAVGGVSTELELKAKYEYDLKQNRITWFALLIKEQRKVGHVGPGLDVVAKLIMTVTPIAESKALLLDDVNRVSTTPSPDVMKLAYLPQTGAWRFLHDRSWYVTSDEKDIVVLRMVERGELIAQCNVSPLTPAAAGKTPSLEQFQEDVQRSLGKNFGQWVNAAETTDSAGSKVFRVVASGVVSGLGVQWIYYQITGREGGRVSLAFTLESELADRFGQADKSLVSTLRFSSPTAAAAVPAPATR